MEIATIKKTTISLFENYINADVEDNWKRSLEQKRTSLVRVLVFSIFPVEIKAHYLLEVRWCNGCCVSLSLSQNAGW